MIWSTKFDLFKQNTAESASVINFSLDKSDIISDLLLEPIEVDPSFDTFDFAPVVASGSASAFGIGFASASFSGSVSGSGVSSISVSASSYVAPDGSSSSFLDVSATGDSVLGSGSVQAGSDTDGFFFGAPEVDLAPATPFDFSLIDLAPKPEIDFSHLLTDAWF